MKQKVAPDIDARISEKATLGRQAWKSGAVAEAETYFLEAWALLPDPKTDCDYFGQSLPRGMVTFYRDTKQFEKANHWLGVMREAYGPGPDVSVEFLAATVYFEAGDLNGAFRIFDALFKKYKQRPFQGENKRYLELYKQWVAGGKMIAPEMPARSDAPAESNARSGADGQTTLSPEMSDRLTALADEGNALSDDGNHEAAIAKWSEALDLIPEPKTDWEASTWLYTAIGDAYYALGKFEDARAAFFDALNCPDADDKAFIPYRLGQSQIRLGNEEKGVEYLLRAYMLDGERIFSTKEGAEFLDILRREKLV